MWEDRDGERCNKGFVNTYSQLDSIQLSLKEDKNTFKPAVFEYDGFHKVAMFGSGTGIVLVFGELIMCVGESVLVNSQS